MQVHITCKLQHTLAASQSTVSFDWRLLTHVAHNGHVIQTEEVGSIVEVGWDVPI